MPAIFVVTVSTLHLLPSVSLNNHRVINSPSETSEMASLGGIVITESNYCHSSCTTILLDLEVQRGGQGSRYILGIVRIFAVVEASI